MDEKKHSIQLDSQATGQISCGADCGADCRASGQNGCQSGCQASPLAAGSASPSAVLSTATAPAEAALQELALDGVRYVELQQAGRVWHLGSTSPLWRQDMLLTGEEPSAAELAALAERGLWLGEQQDGPPLAVMCCGLGSVWPGMGRELYDTFPAAREGMDRLAALADWDLLSLMDETDPEKIGQTRWQIPYLFLLEYAQWCQFVSLGLKPSLLCGHSLGELIALCFAGIYEPEVAWYILETRAIHMAELEARATHETGMMAVHAGADVIAEARRQWPDLYISNYNTPRQFILSGPRDILLEARKSLRRRRIPAMMLNVSLAFHHPSMRVLRDLSQRRLNALEMHPPRVPMLSDITTGFYPQEQAEICRYITDLDENTVRWVDCVQAMWQRDGIRHFLELGPQDTLCGLVADIESRALCFSASRKNREVEGLRQTCARLYAQGHLKHADIAVAAARTRQWTAPASRAASPVEAPACSTHKTTVSAAQMQTVLEVLAEASGRPVEQLRPDMDLRYDLALRSSRFPLIVEQVEKRLGCTVNFEDLLRISTIMDLARVLVSSIPAAAAEPQAAPDATAPETSVQDVTEQDVTAPASAGPASAGPACSEAEAPDSPAPVPASPIPDSTAAESPAAKGSATAGTAPVAAVGSLFSASMSAPLRARPPLCRWLEQTGPTAVSLPQDAGRPAITALPLDVAATGLPLTSGQQIAVFSAASPLVPGLFTGLAPLGLTLALPASLQEACAPLRKAGATLLPLPWSEDCWQAAALVAALENLRAAGTLVTAVFLLLQEPAALSELVEPVLAWLAQQQKQAPQPEDKKAAAGGQRPWLCCLLDVAGLDTLADSAVSAAELEPLGQKYGVPTLAIRCLRDEPVPGPNEMGDMLAREILYGTAPQVLWARQAALGLPGDSGLAFVPRVDVFPLVFSDARPPLPAQSTLYQGLCHFSRYADTTLAAHGGQGENAVQARAPWLPVSRGLQALLEAAGQYLPWLHVSGLSDVSIYELPALPPALTRECRVRVHARPWLSHDRIMTRMCHAAADVRQMTDNGRHTDHYAPLVSGMVLLAAAAPPVPPLWPAEPHDNGTGGQDTLEYFYAALGLQAPWKLLSSFTVLQEQRYEAVMTARRPAIAPYRDYGYTVHLTMVEGVVQAALTALALHSVLPGRAAHVAVGDGCQPVDSQIMAARLRCWRLNAAGYIRFGDLPAAEGPWFLQLRRSWADSRLMRFDAQVTDMQGRVVLTLHHLEFDRLEMPGGAERLLCGQQRRAQGGLEGFFYAAYLIFPLVRAAPAVFSGTSAPAAGLCLTEGRAQIPRAARQALAGRSPRRACGK